MGMLEEVGEGLSPFVPSDLFMPMPLLPFLTLLLHYTAETSVVLAQQQVLDSNVLQKLCAKVTWVS